jgi:hypothetical protein
MSVEMRSWAASISSKGIGLKLAMKRHTIQDIFEQDKDTGF